MVIKLHIGAGKRNFGTNWINIDGADFPHIHHHDVTKLPFEDNSVDLIYSSHLIAYFDREEIVPILIEWKRVLKLGGILRLATPDIEAMAKLYVGGLPLQNFLGPMYGKMKMDEEIIYHKTIYDYKSLFKLLTFGLGFKDVKKYDWRDTEHVNYDDHSMAHIPHMEFDKGTLISLNIECVK